ncbi:MAG: peptidase M75 [Paludibacter sp.]|jgi:uncharacterized iron-regulated protein|nr:peptidase M75 [Paludibacter sp.]
MKKTIYLSIIALALAGFTACDPDENITENPNLKLLEQIVPNYVDNTIIPTYKSLADKSIDLHEALLALRANKTDANVLTAATLWKESRNYWEQSEAFLYGAAADFGIDPHIDTWPLDRNALESKLANVENLQNMSDDELVAWAKEQQAGLLGFHGIEFILFADGNTKSASQISDNQLLYAIAIAGDLRNQCIRLEAAWAGLDNVSDEKQEIIENEELTVTFANGKSYGENMKNAGKAGSTYNSFTDATEDIIQGCLDISDEVGAMKIGKAHSGDDINYIESPYSYNSIIDFEGNIESIRNAYLGGTTDVTRKESLHTFFQKVNSTFDAQVIAAINDAVAKIRAIKNFETNPGSVQAGAAIEAIGNLTDLFEQMQGNNGELRKAVE